ncbi:MAG: type II secretion system protein GspD [Rhodospirillales bacterium 20-64-7]|nr:MAG: type II secretion system protein GspD [Rhodospirillales bacterium 20-64-7]HQT75524.1 type II secretion system secretin GspD [Rhodopila sp.]
MLFDKSRLYRPGLTVALALSTLPLSGCNPPPKPAVAALQPLPSGGQAAPPRVNGAVGTPDALPPAQFGYGSAARVPPAAPPATAGAGDITLDFADTDIREVVAQILGTILKVNYTIDPSVHGTATLHTVRPLNRSELVPTLESLLSQNGAALLQSGSLYRVVPAAQAVTTAATDAGTAGAVIVPLQYTSAEALAKILQPYVGQGGKIAAEPGRNALLIGGDTQARDGLVNLVKAFDVDVLAQQSYALLPVDNEDVKSFAAALQDAFRSQNGGALAGLVHVVPLNRINAVMVISSQSRYIDQARRVYALIERARVQTLRSWHVFYLQNSHSEDAAFVLQQAFTPNNVTAQPTGRAQSQNGMQGGGGQFGGSQMGGGGGFGGGGFGGAQGGGQFGGQGGGQFGGQGGGQGGGQMGGLSTMGGSAGSLGRSNLGGGIGGASATGAAGGSAPGGANANPLLGGLQPNEGSDNTNTLRVIPDDQNNAVLVYGTAREVATVQAMLNKIDILPLQVRIDAVIAEVTLNDNLQYGTQFFFRAGGLNSVLSSSNTPATAPASSNLAFNLPGFIIGGHGTGGAPFAIQALQQVTTVRVLSSPELLVLDNQPARLQVGNVVPYLSQTSQSTIVTNAPVVSSINYQQTGVILEVTPRVNSGGLVTMDVMQDVSNVVSTLTTPGINSPTFSERNVTSRVVVQDGQTIGLAGLITDNSTEGNQGIPWLKDVPLLGLLAGTQNNARQRTELLILITPHVIHDQRDARALTEDLRDQLINAAAVPATLNGLGPSGSSDPSARMRRQLRLQQ